jgi:hypothetical protein
LAGYALRSAGTRPARSWGRCWARTTSRRASASFSDYLRCAFVEGGEPDCYGWVAIRGSMLRFDGNEIIGGGGRYLGATGRAVKNKEVPGGSDLVVKVRLP